MSGIHSEIDSNSIGMSSGFRRILQQATFGLQIQLAQPEDLSEPEKAGIGVAAVVLGVIFVIIGFLCWRRRRNSRLYSRKSVEVRRVERIEGSRRGYFTDAESSRAGLSSMVYPDIESPRSTREYLDEPFDATMVHA
jgi:hypothetical protein